MATGWGIARIALQTAASEADSPQRQVLDGVLVAAVAVGLAQIALTALALLSSLDRADFAIEPLVRGELTGMRRSRTFAAALATLPHVQACGAYGPAVLMAALGSGALPDTIGALQLRTNTIEAATGPWLVWMVVGPLYAALLALGSQAHPLVARAWLRRSTACAVAVGPAETVSSAG